MPDKITYPRTCERCAQTYDKQNAYYRHNKTCHGNRQGTNNTITTTTTNRVQNIVINATTKAEFNAEVDKLLANGTMNQELADKLRHLFNGSLSTNVFRG